MQRVALVISAALTILLTYLASAVAQRSFPGPHTFEQEGGETIFQGVCRDCHMSDARGAIGAGMYPALARNTKLEVAGYPVSVVLNGQKAMPAFGSLLTDQQIADVVNYVRTHFGNSYKDKVTAADVHGAR